MATSRFRTQQFDSGDFVESCGTILFDMTPGTVRVCLFHLTPQDEWLLPKGRRRIGEPRHAAAMRETREETGYKCSLYPVKMPSCAPLETEDGEIDQGCVVRESTDPFYLSIRHLEDGPRVKLIFWYIATVDPATPVGKPEAAAEFQTSFLSPQRALKQLTFEDDRIVLRQAIKLLDLNCT